MRKHNGQFIWIFNLDTLHKFQLTPFIPEPKVAWTKHYCFRYLFYSISLYFYSKWWKKHVVLCKNIWNFVILLRNNFNSLFEGNTTYKKGGREVFFIIFISLKRMSTTFVVLHSLSKRIFFYSFLFYLIFHFFINIYIKLSYWSMMITQKENIIYIAHKK